MEKRIEGLKNLILDMGAVEFENGEPDKYQSVLITIYNLFRNGRGSQVDKVLKQNFSDRYETPPPLIEFRDN